MRKRSIQFLSLNQFVPETFKLDEKKIIEMLFLIYINVNLFLYKT